MYLNDIVVPHEKLARGLLEEGAVSLPLLRLDSLPRLIAEARLPKVEFQKLPEKVGKRGVRQDMEVWHVTDRESHFWKLANALTRFFAEKPISQSFERELEFNEVEVLRYHSKSIGIEPHRDSRKYVSIICLCNLTGNGRFVTCSNVRGDDPKVHRSEPGDVVVLRGYGFGCEYQPTHYVPPVLSERLVCAVRQNTEI